MSQMDNKALSNNDFCTKENLVNTWTVDEEKQLQQAFTNASVAAWVVAADAKAEKAAADAKAKKALRAFARDAAWIIATSLVTTFAIFGVVALIPRHRDG
jgi:hypothetical protein